MYQASITFHQGTETEYGHDHDCATLDEAVRQIEHWAMGMGGFVRGWINNREVHIKGCRVISSDGQLFCTNPMFHETFAPKGYPRILPRLHDDSVRVILTNPQTYKDQGKDL